MSLRIARRYLFAKKSTNAINIITGIAIFGVSVGSAALVLVLSVFNGFEDLFLSLYNDFNPDVRISPANGKTFDADSAFILKLESLESIERISQTLEEVAFFTYRDKKGFGRLRGVDEVYIRVNQIDSTIREGVYRLHEPDRTTALVGVQMRNKLGVDVSDQLEAISVYMPKRKQSRSLIGQVKDFNTAYAYPTGTFQVQQDLDNQFVLVSLDLMRRLMDLPNAVSALEIRLRPGTNQAQALRDIRNLVGEAYEVKDRFEQEAAFLRLMKVEKWISFAIVGLMMLLISFNIVGALWMIVLEKTTDISILKGMGMTDQQIKGIFVRVGLLLCGLGLLIGFVLSAFIYVLQKTVGIITLPGGMLIDAYPVSLRWFDFPIVAVVVFTIGFLASQLPAQRAKRVDAIAREE